MSQPTTQPIEYRWTQLDEAIALIGNRLAPFRVRGPAGPYDGRVRIDRFGGLTLVSSRCGRYLELLELAADVDVPPPAPPEP